MLPIKINTSISYTKSLTKYTRVKSNKIITLSSRLSRLITQDQVALYTE
jgi:hypothetical protein